MEKRLLKVPREQIDWFEGNFMPVVEQHELSVNWSLICSVIYANDVHGLGYYNQSILILDQAAECVNNGEAATGTCFYMDILWEVLDKALLHEYYEIAHNIRLVNNDLHTVFCCCGEMRLKKIKAPF